MPGMCAAVGLDDRLADRLLLDFREIWPEAVWYRSEGGLIAAHAHSGRALLSNESQHLAVDGDATCYRRLSRSTVLRADHFCADTPGLPHAGSASCNSALLNVTDRVLHVTAAAAGGIPLYYCRVGAGFACSSHVRPLARILGASADPIAVAEFLSHGAAFAGRSLFAGITRLRPGQTASFRADGGTLQLQQELSFWSDAGTFEGSIDDAADSTWDAISHSVGEAIGNDSSPALMLSAGWDSRTLLAACREQSFFRRLQCYTHGDLLSRELRLTATLAQLAGTSLHTEPLDHRLFDDDLLATAIERTENVVFPHWHLAGRIMASLGTTTVMAGVYGELLGGHYGAANLASGWGKALQVGRDLFWGGRRDSPAGDWREQGREVLRRKYVRVPRYLRPAAWPTRAALTTGVEADIRTDLLHFEGSGITSLDALIEAHHYEYRAAQYVAAQLHSCRAFTDVAQPLADPRLLRITASIPASLKIHNRLNRRMLRRHAPDTLRIPMGATLVRADAPIAVQELSRVLRRALESSRGRLHSASRGAVAPPRYGWVNFEFLRNSDSLRRLVRSFDAELWDLDLLEQMVLSLRTPGSRLSPHSVFDQLMRLRTVDRVLSLR